jgi:hypothetical protein
MPTAGGADLSDLVRESIGPFLLSCYMLILGVFCSTLSCARNECRITIILRRYGMLGSSQDIGRCPINSFALRGDLGL